MRFVFLVGVLGVAGSLAGGVIPEETDVVVAGGTFAGVRAALQAKAEGKRVFLAAPRPYLGEDRAGTCDLLRGERDDANDPLVRAVFDPKFKPEAACRVLKARGWRCLDLYAPYTNPTNLPPVRIKDGLTVFTTPLAIKRALDRLLLDAGVAFCTGLQITDVQRAEKGWQVTVMGRDGARIVRAREIVDATIRGKVAARAGGTRRPFPAGRYRFLRHFVVDEKQPHLETRTFDIDMADGSDEAFQEADHRIRDLSPAATYVEVGETPVLENPPDVFTALPEGVRRVSDWEVPAKPPVMAAAACDAKTQQLEKLITSYDVVVVGGGTAGACAGLGAAQQGARVLVVEFNPILGGVGTDGRICGYYDGKYVTGFTAEVDKGFRGKGGQYWHAKSEWLRAEIRKRRGTVWFGAAGRGVLMKGNRVTGVRVVMADGTVRLVKAQAVVDATGNADVAAQAGAPTEFISADELSLQGAGWAGSPLVAKTVNSDVGFVDDTSAESIFWFALRTRQSLPEVGVWNQTSTVASRERRRIFGDARVTPVDIILGRTYPDTICRCRSAFDTHGQTTYPLFFLMETGDHKPWWADIPYRALLPKGVEGLLVVGLGMSAHRDSMPVLRMQASIQNMGYVAGVAAAWSAREGLTPRTIDVKALQRHLVEKGNVEADILRAKDSFPLPDARFEAATHALTNGFGGFSVLLTDAARAVKFLKRAYARDRQLEQAQVLAMFGERDGAARLISALRDETWDKGWNWKGMSQYGRSVSRVDGLVECVGRVGGAGAFEALREKAGALTAESEYSHFRVLARAFVALGDRRAVPELARLLNLDGVGGHAARPGEPPEIKGYSDMLSNAERSDVLREICLAAALHRLGDTADRLGARTLASYLHDNRGAYSTFVQKVLEPTVK